MIEFLKQLPHLEPYGTPVYFIYLIGALLPIFVGLFFKKRFPVYEEAHPRLGAINGWLHLHKNQGQNDQERVEVKDPLVVTLASIEFIGVDPKDLPKEVEKNRIDLFQIRPCQH